MERPNIISRDNFSNLPHHGFEQYNPYSGFNNKYYGENGGPLFLPHLTQMEENKIGMNHPNLHGHPSPHNVSNSRDADFKQGSTQNDRRDKESTSTSDRGNTKTTFEQDSESEEDEDEISNSKKRKPRTKLTAEQKRNKKREIVKHSEQRRRVRLNERFEELKGLLPGNRDDINKLTKEMILTEAVQFLKQLQNNSSSVQQTSNALEDPFNRLPISKEEIEMGFNVIYSKELQQLTVVQSFGKLLATQESVNKVLELAIMSENELYMLYAYMLKNMFYSVVWSHPSEMLVCLDKAFGLYVKIKKSQDKPLIYFGIDIGVMIMINYAHAFAMIGQFDKTMSCWQEAIKIAKQIKHMPSEASAYSCIRFLRFAKGDAISIEEAENIRSLNKYHSRLSPIGDFSIAIALIESKTYKSETEKRELIHHLNESLNASIKAFGSMADMSLRALTIQALLVADPEEALRAARTCIRRIEETSITGMWSKAEFLRLEAEAMMVIPSPNAEESNLKEHEVKLLLREAVKISVQENQLASCLKSLVALCKLFMKRGEMYEMTPFVRHMKSITEVMAEVCSHPSKLIMDATAIVDNFQRFCINFP